MPTLPDQTLLTVQEAADLLKVSAKTMRRWEAKGILIPIRTEGGHRRYSLSALQEYKKGHKKGRARGTKKNISRTPIFNSPSLEHKSDFLSPLSSSAYIKPVVHPNPQKSILEPDTKSDQSRNPQNNTRQGYSKGISRRQQNAAILFTSLIVASVIAFQKPLSKEISNITNGNKRPQLSFAGFQIQKILPNVSLSFFNRNSGSDQLAANVKTKPNFSQVLAESISTNNVLFKVSVDGQFEGDLQVDGGNLTTQATEFNIFNENATTINLGGQATEVNIGSDTGTTTINNDAVVTGNLDVNGITNDIAGTLNLSGNTLSSSGDLLIDPGGGGVSIGTGTPTDVDLTGDDLYVSGDFEVDGTSYIPTLAIGGDIFTDLTGTGLQVASGVLETTLGTSISSSEIENDAIVEEDLNISNSGTNGYLLSYNSSTGGFTWVTASTDSGFTDAGTLVTLTTTTDNVSIGGSTDLGKLAVDGDTDEIQLLVQGNSTQTSDIFVVEQSDGTDLATIDTSTLALNGITLSSTGDLELDSSAGSLILTGFDCTAYSNGGALTVDASGVVTCSNDEGGSGGGDVSGPGSSTDNALVRWNGAGGTSIQNSGIIIDDLDNVTGVTSLTASTLTDGTASLSSGTLDFGTNTISDGNFNGNWAFNSGDLSGINALTAGGTITFSDLSTDGIVTVASGALGSTATIGSSYITDGSLVNADINASAAIAYSKLNLSGSIVTGDITDNTLTASDLAATLTFSDGDLIDLSAINNSSTSEGLLLPQATTCSSGTANGQLCWDNDTFALYVGNGSGVTLIGGTGGGNVLGPGPSVTDNAVIRFDGTGGYTIQESGVVIDDSNNVTGIASLTATTLTDGTASLSSGTLDLGTNTISDGNFNGNWNFNSSTINGITSLTATTITDGTASLSSGTLDLGTNTIDDGNFNGAWTFDSDITFDEATNDLTLAVADQTNGAYTLTIPALTASADVCLSTGNCTGAGGGSGVTYTSQTTNALTKFTSTSGQITSSTITDDGSTVSTSVDLTVAGGALTLGSATQDGTLTIYNNSSNFYNLFQTSDSQTQNNTYTLPVDDGSNNYVLATDGSGILSWKSVSGVGGGSGTITAVGNITSGDAFTSGTPGSSLFFADNGYLGLGASAGRIEFDDQTTDEVNILSANVGIGTSTPGSKLEISDGTDSLQIAASGDLTFVDADGAATITGPAGGSLSVLSGSSQSLVLGDAATGSNNGTVSIFSSDWEISATGAITGVSFDANGSGNSISNIENADISASAAIAYSKLNLSNSIVTGDITDNTITTSDLASTLTFADGDLIDLSSINNSSATEGLLIPQATSCSSGTANGQLCWDNDTFALYVGNGSGVTLIGGTGGGDITSVSAGDGLTGGGSSGDVTLDVGAGNGITVNANDIAVNQAYDFTFTGNNAFTPSSTNDLDINLDSDSLLTIDQAFSSTTSANSLTLTGTNASTSGTQNLLYIDNAASTGTTESLLVLDNSDTDTAVTNGIQFIDAGGGFTNLFTVGATNISSSEFTVLDGGITLGTETDGNYVATISGNTQIGVSGSGSETAAVSLSINSDSITASQLSATLTFADSDLLDLSAINNSSSSEGLLVPQATSCSSGTANGQLCWDNDTFALYVGNGSGVTLIGGTGGGNVLGPGSATDNALVRWDTTDGYTIQNSGVVVDDSNNVTGVGNLTVSGTTGLTLSGTGADLIFANSERITNDTDGQFNFGRNDAGTVTLTANDNDSTAALAILPGGAAGLTLGGASTTALTVTTDGSGTAEVVLPAESIDSTEILDGTIVNGDISGSAAIAYSKLNLTDSIVNADINSAAAIAYSKLNLSNSIVTGDITDNTLTASDLAATLTFADSDLIDLSAINNSSSSEGLIVPQTTSCSSATANGQLCWDNDTFALYIGNGSSAALVGGTGTGDITAVGNITSGDAFTSGTPGSSLFFADDGYLGLGASAGRIGFDDQTTDEVYFLNANVGIGTSDPTTELTILSDSTNSDVLLVNANDGSRLARLTETSGGAGWFEIDNASGTAVSLLRADGGDSYHSTGDFGFGTTVADRAVEINSSSGNNLRLTYNDNNGSATNYVDLLTTSSGDLTITPSGGDVSITGNVLPASADTYNLGSASAEWNSLYVGDDAGLLLGQDQDWTFLYDETTDDRLELTTSGTSGLLVSSATVAGTGFLNNFDSLTTGTGLSLSLDALTSGTGVLVESAGSNTITGDLFRINIGSSVTATGDLFTVEDNGSQLFGLNDTQITSALPHQFTAAGDVAIAYDIQLTNQTASYIKSSGPLYLEAGESFENNNLSVKTYGTGDVVFDNDGTITAQINDDGTIYAGSFTSSGTAALCWDNSGGSTINDCSGSPVSDYAEIYPTQPEVGFAEIVSLSSIYTTVDFIQTDQRGNSLPAEKKTISVLEKATQANAKVIGITTQNWSDFSSTGHNSVSANDNPKPVALVGRVPVKVSNTSAPISPGDMIGASSVAGKAQKSSGGYVVGQALESWQPNSGKDTVLVFVNPNYYLGSLADNGNLSQQFDQIATTSNSTNQALNLLANTVATHENDLTQLRDLPNQVASISAELDLVKETLRTAQESGSSLYDVNQDNRITDLENRMLEQDSLFSVDSEGYQLLSIDRANFTDLTVLGDTILGDTVINGKLNIGTIQIDNIENSIDAIGTLKIQPLALGSIEFMGGLITFDTEGNAKVNEITANKYKVAGASAGTAILPPNQTSIFIPSTAVTSDSLIFVTAKKAITIPLAVTFKSESTGFTVGLTNSQSQEIEFDWWIVDKVNQ